jgi:hypothetical protein
MKARVRAAQQRAIADLVVLAPDCFVASLLAITSPFERPVQTNRRDVREHQKPETQILIGQVFKLGGCSGSG